MNYQPDLDFLRSLQHSLNGEICRNTNNLNARIEFDEDRFNYLFLVDEISDSDNDEDLFSFISEGLQVNIYGSWAARRTSINKPERLMSRYTEYEVNSFESVGWVKEIAFYRSFLRAPQNFIHAFAGRTNSLNLIIENVSIKLYESEGFLIVENETAVEYETFCEIKYNVLVALGFVSGKFIQEHVYTFSRMLKDSDQPGFKYCRLRNGFSSIYHAVTCNPYGYKHLIGEAKAQELYDGNVLKPLDAQTISRLAALSLGNRQIQYALVLFNEANGNGLSLLVKNNCFFAVVEVLKKYFHDIFKSQLPRDYSQKGNIEKFKMIFECIAPISEYDIATLEKRNVFMHGDIKDIEGEEMVSLMQRQITFVYKVLLSYVGFDGFIIDHYAIRNNEPEKAFIRLNERYATT